MIGIFDSGSGGLTVLKAIRGVLPSADVVYFGDIKNAPYGEKSREELSMLTVHALELLQKRGATNIVSACNSVSASLAVSLFDAFNIAPKQLIEMVGPTVAYFRGSPARVLLCATPATIASGIYQSGFRMVGKDITALPIEGLAGAIEFGKPQEKIQSIAADAFKNIVWSEYDVLVLACTHYPLALEAFKALMPASVVIFDPAIAVAERVQTQFWPQEVGDGKTSFLVSKETSQFRALVENLFPNKSFLLEVVE